MSLEREIRLLRVALRDLTGTGRMYFRIGPVTEQNGPVAAVINKNSTLKGEIMATLTLTASQRCELNVAFVDKKGNAAPVQSIDWLVDNSELLQLLPSDVATNCPIVPKGPLGTANVTVKADADLGDGVTEIIGTLEVKIVAGQAVTVEIVPGTPTEQE